MEAENKLDKAYEMGYRAGLGLLEYDDWKLFLDDDEWMEMYHRGRADGEGDLDIGVDEMARIAYNRKREKVKGAINVTLNNDGSITVDNHKGIKLDTELGEHLNEMIEDERRA